MKKQMPLPLSSREQSFVQQLQAAREHEQLSSAVIAAREAFTVLRSRGKDATAQDRERYVRALHAVPMGDRARIWEREGKK